MACPWENISHDPWGTVHYIVRSGQLSESRRLAVLLLVQALITWRLDCRLQALPLGMRLEWHDQVSGKSVFSFSRGVAIAELLREAIHDSGLRSDQVELIEGI